MELKLEVPDSVSKLIQAAHVLRKEGEDINSIISGILEDGLKQKLHSLIGPTDVIVQMDTPLFNFKTDEKKMTEAFFKGQRKEPQINNPNSPTNADPLVFDDPSGIGAGLGDIDQEEEPKFVPPEVPNEADDTETFSAMVQSGITDQDIEDDMAVADPNLEAKSDSVSTPIDTQDSDSLFSQIAGLPKPNPYSEDVRVARQKARFAQNDRTRRGRATPAEHLD